MFALKSAFLRLIQGRTILYAVNILLADRSGNSGLFTFVPMVNFSLIGHFNTIGPQQIIETASCRKHIAKCWNTFSSIKNCALTHSDRSSCQLMINCSDGKNLDIYIAYISIQHLCIRSISIRHQSLLSGYLVFCTELCSLLGSGPHAQSEEPLIMPMLPKRFCQKRLENYYLWNGKALNL